MVATKHALAHAEPTTRPVASEMHRLHGAWKRADGSLLLHIHAKPLKASQAAPCTLEIPAPARLAKPNQIARRVEVSTAALRLGWDEIAGGATNLHALPLGPVMTFTPKESYDWGRVELPADRVEEIRLVHRPGSVSQWEILHVREQPAAGQARFTIYEVRPTMVPVNNSAKLAFVPFAVTEDVLTNVTIGPAVVATVVAVPVALIYAGGLPVKAVCELLWGGTKAIGRGFGLVEKDGSP